MTTAAHRPRPVPAAEPAHRVVEAVEACLEDMLANATAELVGLDAGLEPLARTAARAVLAGGKRLRPVFAYWGWRGAWPEAAAAPDDPVETVIPVFAALEMLHTFALVHDDVMDESPVRRGRPSAHAALAALVHAASAHAAGEPRAAPRDPAAARFGRSAAILVGDLCLVWADQLFARAALPAAAILRAREVYDRMRVEAIAGQFLDVLGEAVQDRSPARARRAVHLKTAAYTVVRPLHLGASLARPGPCRGEAGTAELTGAYTRYGLAVGEAFQLRDDLLDAYGDPSVTGKPAGGDLARARPTVLLDLALRLASEPQRAELERQLAGGSDPVRLAALVAETGAPAQVERRISRCTAEALAVLDEAPLDPEVRQALGDLARRAAQRTS